MTDNTGPDDNTPEIAKIERELDILRSRYATYVYWAKVVKQAYIWAGIILLGLLLLLATHEPIMALLIVFPLLTFGLVYGLVTYRFTGRWIDYVSSMGGMPWAGVKTSEARAIEDMIAAREARLTELRRTIT